VNLRRDERILLYRNDSNPLASTKGGLMIAISYRREDSTPVAGRLHDRLQADFGRGNVFMDFDSIPFGVDFREQIKQTLERARVVVAVIGPNWLGGRGKGNRRIDDPADFVRLEIALALERGIPVIPVLVGDTPMPKVETLPIDLKGLPFRNALVLDTGVDFHHHADRLIAGIRDLVKPPISAGSSQQEKTESTETKSTGPAAPAQWQEERIAPVDRARRKKTILVSSSALLVAFAAAAGYYFFAKIGRPRTQPALSLAIATPSPLTVETPVVAPTDTATAPPTPVTTPSIAVAPAPIPTPPPPPPPPPSPPNSTITDDEVQAFVTAHYRATERKDLDFLLSQYEDLVDYRTDGRRDKAFIRNGYVNYFRRWPTTSFTVGDIRVMHSLSPDTATAYFEIRFLVQDIASNRSKTGRASEEWVLSKSFGTLKMTSEKEAVHSDVPDRRRNRR
jgi:hypothetical protein